MGMRIGKVTNVFPSTGKVKVVYEDERSASLPLAMLTMNREYSMPAVGDKVVTYHMENGSSKGFVLGTYYGGGMQPMANSGYRKDFGGGAYASSNGGIYLLSAGTVQVKGGSKASVSAGGAAVSVGGSASLIGSEVTIGSGAVPEDGEGEGDPAVYLKVTADSAEIKAPGGVTVETDGDLLLKASSATIEADDITLQCSYGTITVEDLMKRLERAEDALGLPHTV